LEDLSTISDVFEPGWGNEGEGDGGNAFDLDHELHR